MKITRSGYTSIRPTVTSLFVLYTVHQTIELQGGVCTIVPYGHNVFLEDFIRVRDVSSDELHLNAVMKGNGNGLPSLHSYSMLQEGDNDVKAGGNY